MEFDGSPCVGHCDIDRPNRSDFLRVDTPKHPPERFVSAISLVFPILSRGGFGYHTACLPLVLTMNSAGDYASHLQHRVLRSLLRDAHLNPVQLRDVGSCDAVQAEQDIREVDMMQTISPDMFINATGSALPTSCGTPDQTPTCFPRITTYPHLESNPHTATGYPRGCHPMS
jgi:hypothetical protein